MMADGRRRMTRAEAGTRCQAMSELRLSVISPVLGGRSIHLFLESLSRQSLPHSAFELILVVDDLIVPILPPVDSFPFRTRVLFGHRSGGSEGHSAGILRNLAVRHAAAERVVFVDSDCLLAPNCLAAHLPASVEDPAHLAICGAYRELPATHPLGESSFSYDELRALSLPDDRRDRPCDDRTEIDARWNEFRARNASAPRPLVLSVGGFDEHGVRCQDVGLAYRLHLAGVRFQYVSSCEVIHVEHPRSVFSSEQQIRGWRQIANKHPELTPHAHDEEVRLGRSILQVKSRCERLFRKIVDGLPGVRAQWSWVVPSGVPTEQVLRQLSGFPYCRVRRRDSEEFFLRLDRACWDYSVVTSQNSSATETPAFSVVIPVFNAAETLPRAVESVLVQTCQSFEVIVVDDASTDESLRCLNTYIPDGRFRVLSQKTNRGLAHSMNRGLEHSSGKYLVQLDADDWLSPTALEVLQTCFESKPGIGAVYGASTIHDFRGARSRGGAQVSSPADCLTYQHATAPRAFHVEALVAANGWDVSDAYDGRYFEDRSILFRVAQRSEILFRDEGLYHLERRPSSSLSRSDPLKAASAKLGILWGHANAMNARLAFGFDGKYRRGRWLERGPASRQIGWSVIIPNCGRTEYLELCLRSWLESDVSTGPGEILLVEYGEPDRACPIALSNDPRVRTIHCPEARHQGAAKCRRRPRPPRDVVLFGLRSHRPP